MRGLTRPVADDATACGDMLAIRSQWFTLVAARCKALTPIGTAVADPAGVGLAMAHVKSREAMHTV